jgi:hypothetical protein
MSLVLVVIFGSVLFGVLTPRPNRMLNLVTIGMAVLIALVYISNPGKYS